MVFNVVNMEPERQSSVEPTSTITSSADRMVGVDHAEIRYFTRYEENFAFFNIS